MLRLPGLLPVGVLLLPLACFLILSINVHVSPDLYWYDQQRVGQVAVLVATALSGMACIVLGRGAVSFRRPSPPILLAVAIVFMLGALSAVRSEHVVDAALEWSRFLLIGFLAWSVGNCARTFPGTTSLLLLGALATACLWFLGARFGPYMAILALDLPLSSTAFLAGFDNPRFFGQVQTMTLPLLMLPLVLPGLSRRIRLAAAAFLVVWWMLAWLSGTRGTLYALLATAAAASIVFGARGRAYALASAGFAAAGAVCYGFFLSVLPGWLGTPVDGTGFERSAFGLSSREELWRLSVEYLYEHPLLGIGPMQFAAVSSPIGAHPHSIPLQLAVEWGLPAAIIAMAGAALAVVARAWQLDRQLRAEGAGANVELDALLLIAITAALVQGLVDGVLVVPYTETLLGALVGLAWGRAHRGRECLLVEAGGRMIATLVLCLSASVLAVGTWIQAEQLAERISRQEGQSGVLLPRFWSAGWIDTHAHQ